MSESVNRWSVVMYAIMFNALLWFVVLYSKMDTVHIGEIVMREEVNPTTKTFEHKNRLFEYNGFSSLHMINCSNLDEIVLNKTLGHGWNKETYSGTFRGIPVAVKTVNITNNAMLVTCREVMNNINPALTENLKFLRESCYATSTMKFMKEILMMEQLNHQGLARLMGYCIRNERDVSKSRELKQSGMVSVWELGNILNPIPRPETWQKRLRIAVELADFINYLEHSPLGSLKIGDLKIAHFVEINEQYKHIDLDNFISAEPKCKRRSPQCGFTLPCREGVCKGHNAKFNMDIMNTILFRYMLIQREYPQNMTTELIEINKDLQLNNISAAELKHKLEILQNIYT